MMNSHVSEGRYYIDAISRAKRRDVVMLSFIPPTDEFGKPNWIHPDEIDRLESRNAIIAWLQDKFIDYCPCGEFWDGNSFLSYPGHLYIDIVPDETDLRYLDLQSLLESDIGKLWRASGTRLWVISNSEALKNSHHDAPDYQWD